MLPSRARSPSDHPVDLNGLRVLCVDDEHDILVGMRGLIELWGGKVTTVASVDAAWTLTPDFDAVIADLRLGAANGLDLLRGFAAHAPIRILISATPPIDLIAQLADENITVFAKPIEPFALIDALARSAQKESGSVPPCSTVRASARLTKGHETNAQNFRNSRRNDHALSRNGNCSGRS